MVQRFSFPTRSPAPLLFNNAVGMATACKQTLFKYQNMSNPTWPDSRALSLMDVQVMHLATDWTTTLSDFLKTNDDTTNGFTELLQVQDVNPPCMTAKAPREIINTEARKLIREEKFRQLGGKKKEKILSREIEQFREKLELERNCARFELESAAEAAVLERKHRQIRSGIIRHINEASFNYKKPPISNFDACTLLGQKPPVRNEKYRSSPEVQRNSPDDDKRATKVRKVPSKQILPPPQETNSVAGTPKEVLDKIVKAKPPRKKPSTPSERHKSKTDHLRQILEKKKKQYYWYKWKLYVTGKRKEREEEKIWREKINDFMHRLNERPVKPKQIEKQPKVEEKTNRLRTAPTVRITKIVESKERRHTAPIRKLPIDNDLKEIENEIRESREHAAKQLASKVTPKIDATLKGKAKLVRIITVIPDNEDRTRKQESLEFPHPEIQLMMDRKHEERKKRLERLQEKRRQSEEDKDRLMKERYEQQLLEEELEKRRKLREFREKLRKDREEMELKKAEWKRIKELNELAIDHYRYKLMTKYGFLPWLRLVNRRRIKAREAEEQNCRRLKRLGFQSWQEGVRNIQREKETKAIAHRTRQLIRQCFYDWVLVCIKRYQQMQVAEDWYDYVLVRNSLEAWVNYVDVERQEQQEKWEQAIAYYKMKVETKCLQHWMLLPQVMYLERQKEHRKKQWREKVQQVLPDFKPFIHPDLL